MGFVHHHTVRFHEVDPAGVIFYGRLFQIAHDAFEELMAATGFALDDVVGVAPWALPIVHADADFRRPIRLGDRLRIAVELGRVGAGSLAFEMTFHGDDGTVVARASQVHAVIDFATFAPRSLPEGLVEALRAAV